MLTILPLLLVVQLPAQDAPATDWPQYLGPERNGAAPWPSESFVWPEDGPEVLWRVPTGAGYGGVAVADGEVFLFDHKKDERDVLRVFDLESGEELWSAGYEQKGRLNFDGSRTVPTVVGRRILLASGFGPVSCFDRDEKKLVWTVDLEAEFGGRSPMFGWCTHPVVVGDTVLAAPLGADTGLVALGIADGSVKWRTGHVGYSHSAPVPVRFGGRDQLLFNTCPEPASGRDKAMPATVWSFDPATGAVLWRHDLTLCRIPIPSPVVIDQNRLFLTGGYRAGSVMLRFGEKEDGAPEISELFRSTRGAQIHAPILYEDHLYVIVNENWTESRRRRAEGGLACFDLDGKEVWRTGDAPYFGRGGIVRVADTLLIQDGFDGELFAVRATPEGYRELGRFSAFEIDQRDGQLWAPPAISGTRILMRSQEELICVELAPE